MTKCVKYGVHNRYCKIMSVMRSPHPLPLDGKYHMFCSRENKQSRVYKIGRYKGDADTHYILKDLLFF